MIKIYYKWKLEHTLKRLDLAKRADYEYACKKVLLKHGYTIKSFEKMDESREHITVDPYLERVRDLGYTLSSY